MLVLLLAAISLTAIMSLIFYLDSTVIHKLPESSKLKQWWERHITARYPE